MAHKNSGAEALTRPYVVYQITCIENERFFVGVTNDFKRMKREVLGYWKDCNLQKANLEMLGDYLRYGAKAFFFEILDLSEMAELAGFTWDEIKNSRELMRVIGWYYTLEMVEDRFDLDRPDQWSYIEGLYNAQSLIDGRWLSGRGKELVAELTGMTFGWDGRCVVDVEVGRFKYYKGARRALADKVVKKSYTIRGKFREIRKFSGQ